MNMTVLIILIIKWFQCDLITVGLQIREQEIFINVNIDLGK